MKKFLALLLAMMMVLSFAACGGSEDTTGSSEPAGSGDAAQTTVDYSAVMTDEQYNALVAAYNEVAPIYNEAYTLAETNGWLMDELTVTELNAVGETMGFIGAALTEDPSLLEGSDFDVLPAAVLEFVPALQDLMTRVSVPFEGVDEK